MTDDHGGNEKKKAIATGMETFADEQARNSKDDLKKRTVEAIEEEKTRIEKASLENVHKTFQKWYHIPDTNNIDIILATVLTYAMEGDPLWLIYYGASGDLKSSIVKSLLGLPNVKLVDNLTVNTLASGKPNAGDLGQELQHANTIILIPDMATLMSKNTDEKNEVWGQLRTLYDGYVNKRTGSGVNKAYEGCHVTLIGCATHVICDEDSRSRTIRNEGFPVLHLSGHLRYR